MTAEALKPFLNSANGPTIVADCASKTTKHKCIFFGLVTICFILMFSLIGITIWNFIRMSELKNEINLLNKLVDGMQKKLGLDYFDELAEFENSYKHDLDRDSLDDKRYDDEDDDEDDDFDMDGTGSGSYEYDDSDSDDKLVDDFGKYNESINKKRKTRAITEINGIPVYHESYAIKRNKTGGPQDDKIMKHLLHKHLVPTLRYDWSDKLRPREQLVPSETKYIEAMAATPTVNRVDPKSRHVVYHQPQIRRIPSRHWDEHHNDLRTHSKSGHRIDNNKSRKLIGVLAVQYNLNAVNIKNNYLTKKDDNPNSSLNNNAGNMYIMIPQYWVKNNHMDHAFPTENGVITIKEEGIYYVYAQIYYHNNQDRNGFIIYRNRKPFLQCLSTIPSIMTEKGNTCPTNGITYLSQNDTIQIKDVFNNHSAIFGIARSFIGLVRMGYPEYYQYKK